MKLYNEDAKYGYLLDGRYSIYPIKHGKWEFCEDENYMCCSECNVVWERETIENNNMNYCPNCGTKMDVK